MGRGPASQPAEVSAAIAVVKARLGVMLVERRNQTGVRNAELSRRLGAPPSQIAIWMNQPQRLSLEAAVRLLWAMDAKLTVGIAESGRKDDQGAEG